MFPVILQYFKFDKDCHQEEKGNEETWDGEPGDVSVNAPARHEVCNASRSTVLTNVTAEDDGLNGETKFLLVNVPKSKIIVQIIITNFG